MVHPPSDRRPSAVADVELVEKEAAPLAGADIVVRRRPPGDLIGRERELELLRERLAEAEEGRGGVVAIGGEPGIGKTRLARSFAGLAHGDGATVLWGRCYDGEWAPPYGPWAEVVEDLVRAGEPEGLTTLLAGMGSGAAALARLSPALAPLVPEGEAPAPLVPEEERFRLHDALARLLLAAAAERAMLVVLDDLQWADGPSLGALCHVARLLRPAPGGARLLVVATYRDGELDRDHPLTEALGSLRREAGFAAIGLKGLDRAEVGELLTQAARRGVSEDLARAIHGETEGNPFYVREVMRHLLDEGGLVDRGGRWAAARGDAGLGVPEGVRQVVGRRLARLSGPTRDLLDRAAVFAGGVDFATLAELTGSEETALLDALDEALAAQFLRPVEGRAETYEFAHAIVRQALVAEWGRNPSRAARLHRRAAEALERAHAGREAAHAGELATQYHASRALPGAARGVPHALAAAEGARAAYAHERAVGFLRMARNLAAGLDPGSRGSILARLATAEADALLLAEAVATTEEALAAFAQGEAPPERVAAFLATLAAALKQGGADGSAWRPLVERGLALVGADRGLTWARLTLLRDPVEPVPDGEIRAGRWLGFEPEAVRVARLLGDEEDHARTLESWDPRSRSETRSVIALARTWSRPSARLWALTTAANDLQYRHGAFRDALAVWEEVRATAERYGAVSWRAQALNQEALLRIALGDFALARRAEAQVTDLLARLGPQGGPIGEGDYLLVERTSSFAYYLDGDWSAIASSWDRLLDHAEADGNPVTTLGGPLFVAMAAVAHARAGERTETGRLLAKLTPVLEQLDPRRATLGQNGAIALAAAAIWIARADAFAPVYRRLVAGVVDAGVGDYPQTSNDLTAGRMAALMGDADGIRSAYARARETLDASGQRPLRAIVDHDEAVALVRLGGLESDRAADLLGKARAAFRPLGMDGWDRRSEAVLDEVAALGRRAAYPAGLSEREAEVLRLIARGQSDRSVGDALFISPRTVNAHVRNLLTKTNRANRTELSVWAVEHGLVGERS